MLIDKSAASKMASFISFVLENEDGLGQADDLEMIRMALTRLLDEANLTPKQMLGRVMRTSMLYCALLFCMLDERYACNGQETEFADAIRVIRVKDSVTCGIYDTAIAALKRIDGAQKDIALN